MKTAKDVLKSIKDNDVKYVDFRFTDPRGKWQHVTFDMTHDRRRNLRRRHDVRRLLDRRLEGDQRVRHVPDAGSGDGHDRSVLRRDHAGRSSATFSSRPPASPTTAIRAASPRRPRRWSSRWASATPSSSARKPSSSCSTTCASRPTRTTPASSSTRSSCRPTPTPSTKAATSATASAPRAATSRCRRRTRRRTCAARCSARWPRWASRSRSITTKSPPPSTSSA